MILKYSNKPIDPPFCSPDYRQIDWKTLWKQEVDGVYRMPDGSGFAILYKKRFYYCKDEYEPKIEKTLGIYRFQLNYFYRSPLFEKYLKRIPYEVWDVDTCEYIRTGKPLSMTRKLIYALPEWIRRWIPGINT